LLQKANALLKRLEKVEASVGIGSSGSSSDGSSVAFVEQYQIIVDQYLNPWVQTTSTIGDETLKIQVSYFMDAVHRQKEFLVIAASSKKPSDQVLQKHITPTSNAMGQVTSVKDDPKNRSNKHFNHISALSEGVNALGWVLIAPTPGPHIAETRGSAEFWTNKILKDYKGNDDNHVQWVNNYVGFFKELQNYVKAHHTTGLSWNPRGNDLN